MLENCDIETRRMGVEQLLERWLAERQDFIVQYCGLTGVRAFAPGSNHCNRLRKLCSILVDYVSAGHFEVYYELLREAEAFEDDSIQRALAILPKIQNSTAAALEFDERYGDSDGVTDAGLLANDLSRLGEMMAARFDLEDRLIAVLHGAHQEQVA